VNPDAQRMTYCGLSSYGFGRFFDPFGRPRPRVFNVPSVPAPPVPMLRGFHHFTIADSWSPALAGHPRRRARIVLASSSTIAGPFVFFFRAGTIARVVPVAWCSASGSSTASTFRLVLVTAARPCDLDDGFQACWAVIASRNLPSASRRPSRVFC
jgi:hypothetical protein